MDDEKPIKFIRKRGRIIPIFRTKKQRRDLAHGTSLLAGGVATTTGGSYASGKLILAARKIRQAANIGAQNIMAANSGHVDLKSFRLRKTKTGKILGMGGRASVNPKQLSLFESATKRVSKSFSIKKRVKAYRSAFAARKILGYSHSFAHAAVGLGVDKLIESSGIEKHIGTEYLSEIAGVAAFGTTHSLSRNIYRKVGYGESLKRGFKKDILKSGRKYSSLVKKLGKYYLKKKFKI